VLNGMLAVDLEIRDGQVAIGEVFFPPEDQASVGDEAFRTCFRDAVGGTRFACGGCKVGNLTVPYPVNLRLYQPGHRTADAGLAQQQLAGRGEDDDSTITRAACRECGGGHPAARLLQPAGLRRGGGDRVIRPLGIVERNRRGDHVRHRREVTLFRR
jgi:hypothetical protein